MLELTSAGRRVHLSPGASVQLEYNSPLFDDQQLKGEYSFSFDVLAGPNGPLYGFPERADGLGAAGPLPATLQDGELELLQGQQTVTKATPAKYTVSLQGGLAGLSGRQLSSFAYGGVRLLPPVVSATYGAALLAHMQDVVASPGDYDYVFAPLRNEYLPQPPAAPPDPLAYPPATVNPWQQTGFVNPYATVQYPVMGLPPLVVEPAAGGVCPFPRLRYVLQAILEEAGFAVDLPNLLPGGLGDLVLVSNAQAVFRSDGQGFGLHLADVVPALTVAELLGALRADLGVAVYVEARTRRARTAYLVERVASTAAYQELTQLLAGYAEVSLAADAGLTLTYHVDGEDALSKDLLQRQPAAELVLPAVATVADLPATALLADNPRAGQVREVRERGTYYACTLSYRDTVSVNLTWAEQGESLPPVLVNGGGTEQPQQLCYTVVKETRLDAYYQAATTFPCPALSQAPFRADVGTVARSSALRLLFYNGLQLAADGVSRYPELALHNADRSLSLRLGGATGTYATWLWAWLPVKLRATSYKQPLLLTALDLARLDLTRPVRLDGVAYLVRKLSCTVPLRRPATAELVRLW